MMNSRSRDVSLQSSGKIDSGQRWLRRERQSGPSRLALGCRLSLALISAAALGCSEEDTSADVAEAFIIGITPHADFRSTGLVDFSFLPKDAEGEALIEAGVGITIAVTLPAATAAQPRARLENQPNPDAQLVAALDLDSSGSMRTTDPGELRKEAAKQFVDQLGRSDEVGVFDFGAGTSPTLRNTRLLADFTSDSATVESAIDQVAASGGTPMYASITEVLKYFDAKYPMGAANRSLVVLGDGTPNGGGTQAATCAAARETGIPINTIGFGPAADESPRAQTGAVDVLRNLADCSGGAYTGVVEASELSEAFTTFGQAVRSGSIVITVAFDPIPAPRARASGSASLGNKGQTPITLSYTFVAP